MASSVATASHAQTLESYRIKTGTKEVPGSPVDFVTLDAHVPFSPDLIWRLINRVEEFPQYIPRISACQSYGLINGKEQVYVRVRLPWPFADLWNVVALERDPALRRFQWEKIEGNMKSNRGSLEIRPEGTGSWLDFEVSADMGSFLPRWLVRWGTKNFLPKVVYAVGRRLEQEARTPAPELTPPEASPSVK